MRTDAYRPLRSWFCVFALAWTTCLLYAGGFTTSIEAGMAFLDWPLSNGSVNPDGWLTESDKMAEHSHRLLGAIVGLLTVTLAAWSSLTDARRWTRRLAWGALGLVVFQGVLGGLRVLLDRLNTGADHNLVAQTFRVAHACTAQVFLCTLVALALANTRRWIAPDPEVRGQPSTALRRAGFVACAAIFVQLVLGALMRHNHAALAIPNFPWSTAEGGLLPAAWSFPVAVHFAHRAWAIVVSGSLVWFAGRLWGARRRPGGSRAGAVVLMGLLAVQIGLGALVVLTLRNPHAATLHMLTGAILLAVCFGLTFSTFRPRLAVPAGERPPRGARPEARPSGETAVPATR